LEDVQRFNYLAFFYCSNKAVACGVLLAWATLLFLVMTITAEAFLCPAIEYLASWLELAPDIAGITLFAFASGAPDLFTQVAALAHGNHVDVELAVRCAVFCVCK
jgi:Ca2+/Na+ antiporter